MIVLDAAVDLQRNSAHSRSMSKRWQCRLGWHQFVRQSGHDNPNHQVCMHCGKKRNIDTTNMLGGMG